MKVQSSDKSLFITTVDKKQPEDSKFKILNQKALNNKIGRHVQKHLFNSCDCDGFDCTVDGCDSCVSAEG